MDKVFVIGRDAVPQHVTLSDGESLRWTLVYIGFVDGDALAGVTTGSEESACGTDAAAGCGDCDVRTRATLGNVRGGTMSEANGGVCAADGPGITVPTAGTPTAIDIQIDIDSPGCEVDIAGLYLCDGNSDVRFTVNVRHNSGGSTSRQLFKGIVGDHARASFDGLIYVRRDAQQTKAYQENHNILLSDTARVEAKPQLEIYADDVECSHGATTGYLNPDEQFYMRSRGIPEDEARRLQMISFLSPVLSRLPADLRAQIESRI